MTRRQLAAVALLGALIGAWLSPGRAYADPVPATAGGVYVASVRTVAHGPALIVKLSNGHADRVRPCRYEDGRHCYWQADRRGNGRGSDFVVLSGIRFYLDLSWIGGTR